MSLNMDRAVLDGLLRWLLVIVALVFVGSYAFGKYVQYKESNIADLDAWMKCAQTEQFSDKAYEFCKEKCSENYIFKKPFDWGDGRGSRVERE